MSFFRFLLLFVVLLLPSAVLAKDYEIDSDPLRVFAPIAEVFLEEHEPLGQGSDLRQVFDYVSSEIGTNLYDGMLRGHHGVLESRAGNSLEQSLLLANLLTQRGLAVRILQAGLPDELAQQKLAAQRRYFDDLKRTLNQPVIEKLQALENGTSEDHVLGYIADAKELFEEIDSRFDEILASAEQIIVPWTLDANEKQAANLANLEQRFFSLAKQHYWVQANIEGSWIDLDPTLVLAWGEAPVPAGQTLDLNVVVAENTYWFTLSIEATFQITGKGRKQIKPLQLKAPVDRIAGYPLVLTHPAKDEGLTVIAPFNVLTDGDVGGINFMPVLLGAGGKFAGDSLRVKSWSGGSGLFGSGGSGLFGGSKKPDFVSEELIVEVSPPSGEVVRKSRFLFDLALPGERMKEGDWQLDSVKLPDDGKTEDGRPLVHIPGGLRAHHTLVVRSYPVAMSKGYKAVGLESWQGGNVSNYKQLIGNLGGVVDAFHRFDEIMRARKLGGELIAFPSAPGVTDFVLLASQDEETPYPTYGLDQISSSLTLPTSGDLLKSGLVELTNEQLFVEALTGNHKKKKPLFTAINLLDSARIQGQELRSVQAGKLDSLSLWPSEFRSQVNVPPQHVYILPAAPLEFQSAPATAWISLNTETYDVSDGTSRGGGNALSEYAQKLKAAFENVRMVCMFRQCLEVAMNTATGFLTLVRGNASFDTIEKISDASNLRTDCSRMKVRMKLYKRWKQSTERAAKDARNKIRGMQNAAKDGKLKTPKEAKYQKLRKKDPGEFASQRERKLGRPKKDSEQWDHRVELGCGGEHKANNVFPLDGRVNGSLGNFFGRMCRAFCECTRIEEIVIDYVLPGGP